MNRRSQKHGREKVACGEPAASGGAKRATPNYMSSSNAPSAAKAPRSAKFGKMAGIARDVIRNGEKNE